MGRSDLVMIIEIRKTLTFKTEKIGIISGLREGASPGSSLRFSLIKRTKVEPIDTDRF